MYFLKPVIQASLLITILLSQSASAQWTNPYYGYNQNRYNNYSTQYNRPYYSQGYRNTYNNRGYYAQPNNYRPYYGSRNYQTPYYRSPYAGAGRYSYPAYRKDNEMKRILNKGPFTGNSDFMEELWPGGRDNIYHDILPIHGPWDNNWGRAPWNRDYDDLWGRDGGPSAWFDPSDPEEGIAEAWEDMMITPNRLGTMPGGWEAPSVSIPNPIDVETEFRDAAIDMPGEMRDFSDGFTYGGDDGYNDNNDDSGSIGFGKKKKDEGISINTNRNRR